MKVKASLATTKLAAKKSIYEVNPMVNKTNSTQSNNTLVRSLMNIALSLGVMLGSGFVYGLVQTAEQPAQTELRRFGRAEYEQLRTGMTLTDVRSILYRGIEVSRSETTATFIWENPDGSKITATFEHDKLKSKKQSGLK